MATSNRSSTASLRLALSPTPGKGALDGAWWPRSQDLEAELADLVDHFPPTAGHVARVLFSRPDWRAQPHRVKVARGYIKTGSFPADDTHVMRLRLATHTELRLLVVPPETPADAGRDLMAHAASPTNRRSGPELLALALAGARLDSGGHWSDDGGAMQPGPPPRHRHLGPDTSTEATTGLAAARP